jgi:hypothetical protein
MRRASRLVLAVFLMTLTIPSHSAEPKGASPPSKIPDPSYVANRGDRAVAAGFDADDGILYEAVGAKNAQSYNVYWRALDRKDDGACDETERAGRVIELPIGTAVLVLEIEGHPKKDPADDAAIVRVLDGTFRGETLWLARFEVVRLIDQPVAPLAVKDSEAEERAAKLLNLAQGLEASGKKDGALNLYAQIIRDFPGTFSAGAAEGHIRTFGGKVPSPRSPSEVRPSEKTSGLIPPKRKRYASQEAQYQQNLQMLSWMGQQAIEEAAEDQAALYWNMTPHSVRPVSHFCGAPTRKGTPCRRLVIGPGFCWQHR